MTDLTIRDVAKKAGVSLGTVSRVLNEVGNVSPELHEKTMAAVKALGYRPIRQSAGRKKIQKQKLGIGFMLPEMSEQWSGKPSFSQYMRGIEEACRDRGRDMALFMKSSGLSELSGLEDRVSGILIKSNSPADELIRQLPPGFPVVGMNTLQPTWPFPQVCFDNYGAGILACQHLIGCGHKRIAFVSTQARHPMFIARSLGYTELMRRYGLFDSDLVVEDCEGAEGDGDPQEHFPDMDEYVDRIIELDATAVIAANDWMAMGIYESCRRKGISIPKQLSCVGFDDIESARNCMVTPPLTTVAMPFAKVASLSANILLDLVDEVSNYLKNTPSMHYLQGTLMDRESVAKM